MDENALIRAGFARRIINPPRGILSIGFGDRFKGNKGVHDDLTATAMVLEENGVKIGLVALDLLAMHEDFTQELEMVYGMPLLLCCAHTHSAPMFMAVNPFRFRVR